MSIDIRSRSSIVSAFDCQTISSSGSVNGETVDFKDFEALDMCFNFEITTGAPVIVNLYEGDESDMSDEALVSTSTGMIGVNTLAQSATGTQVVHFGYVGSKQYLRVKVGTTGSPNMVVAGIAYKSKAKHSPTSLT
jgi:hypothetical protein